MTYYKISQIVSTLITKCVAKNFFKSPNLVTLMTIEVVGWLILSLASSQKKHRNVQKGFLLAASCHCVGHKQREQIGRFIGIRSTFGLWQQLICPNLPHSQAIFVKVSKSIIFLVKSFLGNFCGHLAKKIGHTGHKLQSFTLQPTKRQCSRKLRIWSA